MMVSEKKKTDICGFVSDQLRNEPDLSTLTLGILKKRYLEHVPCESLSPEVKKFMKQVVKEELIKMQDNDEWCESGSELKTKKPQNKRKREKENDEVINGTEDDSTAKKSRRLSNSSSNSEDKEDCKTGSEESEESEEEEQMKPESEDAEQEENESQLTTNGKSKWQLSIDESTDEEMNKSGKKGNGSNCDDSPKEMMIKRADAAKNGDTRSSKTNAGKKTPQSDEDNDSDSKSENSDKVNGNDSSDESDKEEKVLVENKNNEPDSDSSSLTSLEDEKDNGKGKTPAEKTKKTMTKEKSRRDRKDSNKTVARLKRYIHLCGNRLNYKKLLGGCRTVGSQVAVLKKKLEDLGVDGKPTIKKCNIIKTKREETQELADLDVSNIIATKGRPKRRGSSAWEEQKVPLYSTHRRTLNSSSDSDEENNAHRGSRIARDWANLQGIISDDADSN
ncbi:HIRA-interacting protein 3 [Cottoperca gobio]|uniref:HIRA-interacting protein 3 n=1 Tax=Cottoperca gobio TaxID=56716 RepID=A0A6J2QA01_COTGO|nr:HIRA-interacting protein 3 [Cottoperca gobio]